MFAAFFLYDYIVRLFRRGFSVAAPWSRDCILDMVCTVPALMQGSSERSWLSVSYIRSLTVLYAFEALQSSGVALIIINDDLKLRLALACFRLMARALSFAKCVEFY